MTRYMRNVRICVYKWLCWFNALEVLRLRQLRQAEWFVRGQSYLAAAAMRLAEGPIIKMTAGVRIGAAGQMRKFQR